jgi:hypothetical protein
MNPNTMDRISGFFEHIANPSINQAMNYLDSEMRAGNISNYRLRSDLPKSRPLFEGRYLVVQVDGVDVAKADFGVDGFVVSLVDRANEMHMFPSKPIFKSTVKNGLKTFITDYRLDKLYEMAKEMSIYYEQ